MDSLQQQFNEAMRALKEAHDDEAPLWDELCRVGSNPQAPFHPDLADRWYEKRLVTEQRYRDVKDATEAITKFGGIPSLS